MRSTTRKYTLETREPFPSGAPYNSKWVLGETNLNICLESCLADSAIVNAKKDPSGPDTPPYTLVHPTKNMSVLMVELIQQKMEQGELMTIPDLCSRGSGKWSVRPSDFYGLWHGCTDGFLLSGLPHHLFHHNGTTTVLIDPDEFDIFMEGLCGLDEELSALAVVGQ